MIGVDVVARIAVSWAVDEWSDTSVELEVVCSGFVAPAEMVAAAPLVTAAVGENLLRSDGLAEGDVRDMLEDVKLEDCTVELPRQS